jgi:hypothetical protein
MDGIEPVADLPRTGNFRKIGIIIIFGKTGKIATVSLSCETIPTHERRIHPGTP